MKNFLLTISLILCTASSRFAQGSGVHSVLPEKAHLKHSSEVIPHSKHHLCGKSRRHLKLCSQELISSSLPSNTLTRYVLSDSQDSLDASKPLASVYILNHPLIQHKVSLLRNKHTKSKIFRECLKEISLGICYEATRDLPLENIAIETPLIESKCPHLTGPKVVVVPVLRAGLGMVDGFLSLVPTAKVGHIGMSRDHVTFQPTPYCCKLPKDITKCRVFIVDPMLATGGSASATIQLVKEHGAKNITLINVLAVPEGIERIQKDHPDVTIYVAALDEKLNELAYILPGLGDAGDRFCGTEHSS
ncbi:uracil phosphoribosyltransferase [Chlamydia sp.]|uniref:uracil phosphoribosyltransferase n=1 Tax=Chlamydia sp. TaxID=35827 RepID=UPI0025BEBD1D|nr:uracil phosphoribosyltransferase [Chlamydia sp.]MBQ8498960.1 uracil phosphoribosyltransferase [Chlamydia sp.]